MGIASLILGIVSIVWSCLGGTWISALIGVAGIVLGAIGKKKNSSCSVAGLVLLALLPLPLLFNLLKRDLCRIDILDLAEISIFRRIYVSVYFNFRQANRNLRSLYAGSHCCGGAFGI